MNVCVIGGQGMLGSRVVLEARRRGHETSEFPIPQQTELIINCAGKIPLKNPTYEQMIETNAILPWQLASMNIRLIHMSTDCVFSGSEKKALESTTRPDPVDLYGRSKLCGEAGGDHVLNVRGSFIGPEHGFLAWLLAARGTVDAWIHAWWNGGSVEAMARALVDLA